MPLGRPTFNFWLKAWFSSLKVIRFSTPVYLRNLVQFRYNERYSLRSMHLGVLLQDPSVRFKCTLGDTVGLFQRLPPRLGMPCRQTLEVRLTSTPSKPC